MNNTNIYTNELLINFMNNIVYKTLKTKNNNRSGIRAKKLAQKFVESFLVNQETRYYNIDYDSEVFINDDEKLECDVVIRNKDGIKTIIMFKFPIFSLKKNDRNYEKMMKGEALELELSPELNDNTKIFFISFYPNLENIKIKNKLPHNIFKKCSNIEILYDVNKKYHIVKNDYNKGIFINNHENLIESYNIYHGDISDIKNSIYN